MEYVYIDFEFYNTSEKFVTPVCASLLVNNVTESYWLLDKDEAIQRNLWGALKNRLEELQGTHTFVCYAATAEGRAIDALFEGQISLYRFTVIDLHLEYKGVLNHSEYSYGAQLIDGKVKFTEPKLSKWEIENGDEQEYSSDKPSSSLGSAIFKMIGKQIDTQHKTTMRNIIISGDYGSIKANQKFIQEYCDSDVKYLPELTKKILQINRDLIAGNLGYKETEYMASVTNRGSLTFASCTYIEYLGVPLDYEALSNLSENIEDIYADTYADASVRILGEHKFTPFYYSAKERRWKTSEKSLRSFIGSLPQASKWKKTDSGEFSLAGEAFEQFCSERHVYSDNIISQMCRINQLKTSLNSMRINPNKRNFFDSIGSDKRSRPYLNPLGTQSSRFAPPATTFLFAKSAWLRSLCNTENKEKIIISLDYSQQEFLLSAVISGDTNMMQAYTSGDVYLATAKLAKAVPADATKASHPLERQLFKSVVLGISYSMTKYGLAEEIEPYILNQDERNKFGSGCRFKNRSALNDYCMEEANKLIDLFWSAYPTYKEFSDEIHPEYIENEGLAIPFSLFPMHGLNKNKRSVGNVKIQGSGAAILINLLKRLQQWSLSKYSEPCVIAPLHDACYLEIPYYNYSRLKEDLHAIKGCFEKAYLDWASYVSPAGREFPMIRLGGEVWASWIRPGTLHEVALKEVGSKLYEGEIDIAGMKVAVNTVHRDERISVQDFLRYMEYCKPRDAHKEGF